MMGNHLKERIMDILTDSPLTCNELASIAMINRSTVMNALSELQAAGLVEHHGTYDGGGRKPQTIYRMKRTKRAA